MEEFIRFDDAALWAAFHDRTLAHSDWNHVAHVRIAFLSLAATGFDLDEAHLRMRAGIILLNSVHGLTETSQRGYFETLTRAWLFLVRDCALRSNATTSRDLIERFPQLLVRSLTNRYYSPEVLTSTESRACFVGPDREPLPK